MRNLLTGLMATTLAATFVVATAESAPLYAPRSEPAGIIQKAHYDSHSNRSHWRHDRHWGWDNGRHEGWKKKRHWRRHHDDYRYSDRRAFRRHYNHRNNWRHRDRYHDNGVTLHFSF